MDSFHLPQGTWDMEAAKSHGMVLRKSNNILDLCPMFLPTGVMPSLPDPLVRVPIDYFL